MPFADWTSPQFALNRHLRLFTKTMKMTHNQWLDLQIKEFWVRIKDVYDTEPIIALLTEFSNRKKKGGREWTLEVMRRKFNTVTRKKDHLMGNFCFACSARGNHLHHIITLGYGGDNREENLVMLDKKCHIRIHPFMANKMKKR